MYKNGNLEFFNQPEGIVEKEADGYKYVYQFKDHLGNIRLSYKDADKNGAITQSEIIQETNYYPFGLTHKGYNDITRGRNHNYGFGGTEFSNELDLNSYDFGERNYNPALGRWFNIDPLAEFMRSHSPYNFGFNNPIYFSDRGGNIPWPVPEMFKNWERRIDSYFGPRNCSGCSKNHKGLDINFDGGGATDFGAPVLATHSGKVVSIKTTLDGSGRNVYIQSPDGSFQTRYFHLSSILVEPEQEISEGQTIGLIGGSGKGLEQRANGVGYVVHLHYAIIKAPFIEKGASNTWYNPTEGRSNSPNNVVDPQTWITLGPWSESYYNNEDDYFAFYEHPGLSDLIKTSLPTLPKASSVSTLTPGGITPSPTPAPDPGGGTIPAPTPVPAPKPPTIIPAPKPILD